MQASSVRKWSWCAASLAGFAIINGASLIGQSQTTSFVSLPQFVAMLTAAQYSEYAHAPTFGGATPIEFERMRANLLNQYQGVTATNSFVVDGIYVDCIPIMQQPSVRQLGLTAIAPPDPPIHQQIGRASCRERV